MERFAIALIFLFAAGLHQVTSGEYGLKKNQVFLPFSLLVSLYN